MNKFAFDALGRLRPVDSSGRFDNRQPVYERHGYDIRTPLERQCVRLPPPMVHFRLNVATAPSRSPEPTVLPKLDPWRPTFEPRDEETELRGSCSNCGAHHGAHRFWCRHR